ncbi:MAG: toxin [Bacteroidia bacterium]
MSAPKPNIVSPEKVQHFLQDFVTTKNQNGMVFLDRQKNLQALLDLEIGVEEREAIIEKLTYRNYYKGPRPDGLRPGLEFWEFGTQVKGREVYVKLALGIVDGPTLCYSFHPAERAIRYPHQE